MTAVGVIPPHRPPRQPLCEAQHPTTGAPCELDAGHEGQHEAVLLWDDH